MALGSLCYNTWFVLMILVIFSNTQMGFCDSDSEEDGDDNEGGIQPETLQEACNRVIASNQYCDEILRECCRPDRWNELLRYNPVCGFIPGIYEMKFRNWCELMSFRCKYRGTCLLSTHPSLCNYGE